MITNLGISIRELLRFDILKTSKVLAGKNGLNNKITKVNVMEVPDIADWVSKGEFLISTAYSIKNNVEILNEIIPKLNEKGVAGLGIKLGRYIESLPKNIIELADSINFPIIEIPFNIPHTEVISSILTEIVNNKTNMLINIEKFNTELMDIMVKAGDLKEIIEKLNEYVKNSVAIYENISDNYWIACDNELSEAEYKKIIYKYLNDKKHCNSGKHLSIDEIQGKSIERMTFPIIINNIEYGAIFVWCDKKDVSIADKMIIESYLNIIVLEFSKNIAISNIESNYKAEFFDDLLSESQSRQKRAIEKAKSYGYNKENNYSVIMVILRERSDETRSSLDEEINKLKLIINRILKPYKNKTLYIEKSDRIIILYGNDKKDNSSIIKDETLKLGKKIYSEALKQISLMELVIGIGRSYGNFLQLYKSNEQAKLIVEHLSKSTTESIIHYDDLGIYRILAYDGLKTELIDFCQDTIMPLIDHDKVYNTELVKTLKEYFTLNGNVRKISEKMFMHYNTILYRIQKIKDITGLDLEKSDNRLNLQIALKILDIVDI